jgi:hypothetical protein
LIIKFTRCLRGKNDRERRRKKAIVQAVLQASRHFSFTFLPEIIE